MMTTGSTRLLRMAAIALSLSSCSLLEPQQIAGQDYLVHQHQFTIRSLPDSVAHEIASELQTRDIHVLLRGIPTSFESEEKIGDYTFVIKDQPYYTGQEFQKLINTIRSKGSPRIALQRTAIHQIYSAAGFEAMVPLTLSLSIPAGHKAYFKKNRQEIRLNQNEYEPIATFTYSKEPGEKYLDVYTLPEYTSSSTIPRNYQRIELSAPYQTEVLDWHQSWYSAILPEL
jgi:hypothetical protein